MAARYWVGGTASWDGTAGTKWALTSGGAGGQAVPTTADDVFFTNLSTGTCTVAAGNTGAKSINCTGFTGALSVTSSITVAGSITLVAGMTYTQSTGAVTVTVSATGTITSAGKTFHGVTIDAPAGTVQLADAINCGSAGSLVVTSGTFTTNNFSVTALAFISSNTNVRTVNLGSSTVTLSSGSGAPAWNTSGSTNLTLNAGTSTINITTSAQTNFLFGTGKTFNNIAYTGTGALLPTGPCILSGSFTISGTLTLAAPAATGSRIYSFDAGTGKTIGALVASGGSTTRRVRIEADRTQTSQATLTVATYTTKQNIDFIDIVAAGASAPWSGTSIGVINVSNITGSAAKTVYWNLAGSVNWSSNGWAATSGGTPAVSNFPLAQDTAVFDNAGAAGTVSIDSLGLMIPTISALGRTSAMTLSFATDANFWGSSLSFGSGVTVSGSGYLNMFNRTAAVITSNVTMGNNNGIIINKGAGFTLGNALTLIGQIIIDINVSVNITINTAGYNLTTNRFFHTNSYTTTVLTLSSSTVTVTGTSGWQTSTNCTITANTATMSFTSASAKSFVGFGLNYNGLTLNQGGAGALTITGANTFGNITNTYAATGATSILFTAGTTNTFIDWNASGQPTRLLTIGSVTAASHTLSKSTGTVSVDYLSISRSTATGGATWYAGNNSTNGGNNTGWIFTGPPSGNFLAFFM